MRNPTFLRQFHNILIIVLQINQGELPPAVDMWLIIGLFQTDQGKPDTHRDVVGSPAAPVSALSNRNDALAQQLLKDLTGLWPLLYWAVLLQHIWISSLKIKPL